jgi:polyferredoxin
MRTPLGLDVLRDRNALYRETAQGLVENVYTLKVINMDEREHRYRLEIAGLPGATLILEHDDVRVGPGEVLAVPARVRVDPHDLEHASSSLTFLVKALDDPDLSAHQEARFLGPARRAAR